MKRILLIDVSNLANKQFAMRMPKKDAVEQYEKNDIVNYNYVNAFKRKLIELKNEHKADVIELHFDGRSETFIKELCRIQNGEEINDLFYTKGDYEKEVIVLKSMDDRLEIKKVDYKGQREKSRARRHMKNIIDSIFNDESILDIKIDEDRKEADHTIYERTLKREEEEELIIISGDGDFHQLIEKNVRQVSGNKEFHKETFMDDFKFKYKKIIVNDNSDGVMGIMPNLDMGGTNVSIQYGEGRINDYIYEIMEEEDIAARIEREDESVKEEIINRVIIEGSKRLYESHEMKRKTINNKKTKEGKGNLISEVKIEYIEDAIRKGYIRNRQIVRFDSMPKRIEQKEKIITSSRNKKVLKDDFDNFMREKIEIKGKLRTRFSTLWRNVKIDDENNRMVITNEMGTFIYNYEESRENKKRKPKETIYLDAMMVKYEVDGHKSKNWYVITDEKGNPSSNILAKYNEEGNENIIFKEGVSIYEYMQEFIKKYQTDDYEIKNVNERYIKTLEMEIEIYNNKDKTQTNPTTMHI